MESRPRKLVEQIAAALLLCVCSAHAQSENATGGITVNGRHVALRHAYAAPQPGFFDKQTEDIRVLLTDVALDEEARRDTFSLARLAREGKLRGVEVVVNDKGEPMTGFLFLDAFDGLVSAAGMHEFEARQLERSIISGRMFTQGPRTFSGVTWEYDVTFSAAIPRPPTAEEAAAALKSAPGLAASAHLTAIQSGFDAFVATLTAQSAASFRAPEGLNRFNEIRGETPADSRVVSLAPARDGSWIATVQAVRRDGVITESFLTIRQEANDWKVER